MKTKIVSQSENRATIERICSVCCPAENAFQSNSHQCSCEEVTRSVGGTSDLDEFFHKLLCAAEKAMHQYAPEYNRQEFLKKSHIFEKEDKSYLIEITFNGTIKYDITKQVETTDPNCTVTIYGFKSNGKIILRVKPHFNQNN